MRVIGLMSGTSADGIDAALVEWPAGQAASPFHLLAYREVPLPPDIRARVSALAGGQVPAESALKECLALDGLLGAEFADAAHGVSQEAGLALADVDAIASHGQTIAHHPEVSGSLQIGHPSVIAERTGRPVVADFRRGDLAAGGEGAPLAPFFHLVAFRDPEESRVILNLGGMANVTWLPKGADPETVLAFDVGPANSLVDGLVAELTAGAEHMDADGSRAARGRVDHRFLAALLDDPYFRRRPPKSTGREQYGTRRVQEILALWSHDGTASNDDLIATVTALTVESVAQACLELIPRSAKGREAVERLIVGGGGVMNPVMMAGLKRALPGVAVDAMDQHGVPAAAAEAMAFALMGRNALLGEVNHLPQCTGARGSRVLGVQIPGVSVSKPRLE